MAVAIFLATIFTTTSSFVKKLPVLDNSLPYLALCKKRSEAQKNMVWRMDTNK